MPEKPINFFYAEMLRQHVDAHAVDVGQRLLEDEPRVVRRNPDAQLRKRQVKHFNHLSYLWSINCILNVYVIVYYHKMCIL